MGCSASVPEQRQDDHLLNDGTSGDISGDYGFFSCHYPCGAMHCLDFKFGDDANDCHSGVDDDGRGGKRAHHPPFDVDIVHPSRTPYLGSYFFAAPPLDEDDDERGEVPGLGYPASTTLSHVSYGGSDVMTEVLDVDNDEDDVGQTSIPLLLSTSSDSSSSEEGCDEDLEHSYGVEVTPLSRDGYDVGKTKIGVEYAINTLPSFRKGHPLHLKISEVYRGYNPQRLSPSEEGLATTRSRPDDDDEVSHASFPAVMPEFPDDSFTDDFSYDPLLSSGKYKVENATTGRPYGGGLTVSMGAQFTTLRDRHGRVSAATSRVDDNDVRAHVLYSPKPFFEKQRHAAQVDDDRRGAEAAPSVHDRCVLYPWALLAKEGPGLEDRLCLYHVVPNENGNDDGEILLVAGVRFRSRPSLVSANVFENGMHARTVVSRLDSDERTTACCRARRDRFVFDIFDVEIAPGVDPLLIVCCLAVHARMDAEIVVARSKGTPSRPEASLISGGAVSSDGWT